MQNSPDATGSMPAQQGGCGPSQGQGALSARVFHIKAQGLRQQPEGISNHQ